MRDTIKMNVTVNKDLCKRLDEYCKENGDTRSGFVQMAVARELNAFDMLQAVKGIEEALKTVAKKNAIDDETAKKLEALQSAIDMMTGR